MKNKIIVGQIVFLVAVLIAVYFMYPKASVEINGNFVRFGSINANVIIVSENSDFSNPRYIDLSERKDISLNLKPGKYYWKSSNNVIKGLKNEFTIESEVGMGINRSENESELENIGNVKISITKSEGGVMVGRIVLEPDESEKIDDENEKYTGRQIE